MLCDRTSSERSSPSVDSRLPPIDIRRLRRDVAACAVEASSLKQVLRVRWLRPMADEQRQLVALRRRVTELLVLLARARGRYHVTSAPRAVRQAGVAWDRDAWHARIAGRVALDYIPGELEVAP
jgi:hypothetical protein